MRRFVSVRALALVCLGFGFIMPAAASAAIYPTNLCVSSKLHAAANYCRDSLKAWGTWDRLQDNAKRDASLALAATKLLDRWAKAESKSLAKGVDCSGTTLSAAGTQALIDPVVGAIVAAVNTGLTLSEDAHSKCGKKLLTAAAINCGSLLQAESVFLKQLAIDSTSAKRNARKARASTVFNTKWTAAVALDCPTGATAGGTESSITALNSDVVFNSTVAPSVTAGSFDTIHGEPTTYEKRTYNPICQRGTDYNFFVKRGTVNKLVMYYQGGGACWDYFTCEVAHTSDESVNVAGGDNPNVGGHVGLDDATNPNNPFKDWSIVFVPYCSGDVHLGDADADYSDGGSNSVHIQHHGFANAKVAEKWAREHFVNPDQIFVTGSSAGGYGALLHGAWLHRVYPASDFNVLADAANGIITEDFRTQNFPSWGVDNNLPPNLPTVTTLTVPETTAAAANAYPQSKWAHYTTAFDGGTGGQTGFYNVMLNPGNVGQWLNWWNASCAWNSVMRAQALTTYGNATANYRYYIGTGSRHTMFGSSKVYSDTTGGVPTIVDWINAMLTDSPSWTNVEASNQGLLLPGDVRPSPLQAPFQQVGPDVVITCP